jgi:transposase
MGRRKVTVPSVKQPVPLPETVPACHELIEQLLQDLDVLRERVNLNSRNSSKPPSSDGPGTPPRTVKAQSGKRLGGQPGHKGSFRAPLPQDKLTAQVLCPPPSQCTACGDAVHADGDKPMRHWVFELPRIEPIVTEYVRVRGVCSGCASKHHRALPAGVPSGQLGPRALALVGTLAGQFHLTQRKVQDVLSHIMGIRFSLGAVSQAHGLVAQALAAPVAQLHAELQHAPVVHADETRHHSHQHTLWMWVLASDWEGEVSHRSLAWAGCSETDFG